jgi:hypothetical protein
MDLCKLANKPLPWFKYQINKPEAAKNMNVDMRDLRELSIHLARYSPVGPASDVVYLKLAKRVSGRVACPTEFTISFYHI